MDQTPYHRLTERQCQCLRLVNKNLTSKEMAPILGIEAYTIDDHLKRAARILDAPTRRHAARMFAAYEDSLPQKLGHQLSDIAPVDLHDILSPSTARDRDAAQDWEAKAQAPGIFPVELPSSPMMGSFNDLTPAQRLRDAIMLAFMIGLVLIAMLVLAGQLQHDMPQLLRR